MGIVFNSLHGTFDFVGVRGPSSSTDKGIARYDGTTGQLIQDSKALVQDGGAIVAQGFITKKIITDNVTVGSDEVMLTDGFSLEDTGELVIEEDGELVIV